MALDRLSQITSSGISTTISFIAAGINVTGVVTATTFVGDGSGLTGVVGSGSGVIIKDDNATVGTASTINFGSNLSVSAISSGIVTVTGTDTNTTYSQAAVASGSNVNIRLSDSNSTTDDILLTAGSNVTFSSVTAAGFTINSSGSGGSSSQFAETAAGIHTLSNVGIGTTNPTSKLTITGNALVTGVVTATTFVGALTGTASNVTTNANLTGDVTSTGNATSIAAGVIVDADVNASAAIALSKLATTGVITATSFSGSGSGLTNLPSGQLTGALPALDGSALTGVIGSGSGVVIKDSGSLVGTAGTIDFGDNLTVSAISAGIVTVTGSAGGGGSSQFVTTSAGIHTLSNVGIGTTNPQTKLEINGVLGFTGSNVRIGDSNTATSITTGSANIFIGSYSGQYTTSGYANNFLGDGTGSKNTTGSNNNFFGYASGYNNTTGDNNNFLSYAGYANTTGSNNNFFGFGAGNENTSGSDNIYIGQNTGNVNVTGSQNIVIGKDQNAPILNGSNQLVIGAGSTSWITGNSSYNVGIGTTNPTSKLTITGNALVTGVVTATTFVGALTGNASSATTATIATYTSEWTLGANGSADYTFTGPGFTGAESDPTLYLIRGQQYKFTNTMGAHPFRIQSTVNGSTGTQYNDGITNNDVSNGTLTWDVQFDAPNIIYYQCTAHSGMGGKIYILNSEDNVSAGTTSAPSISPSGDSNTGIFFPTADTIAFAEGGVEALRVDSSGNLGIGTITPRTKLDVAGGGYFTGFSNPTDSGRAGLEIGYDGSKGVVQCYDRPNGVFKDIQYYGTQHIFSGGNIKVDSGYGIDFSANANAAGMTSELLDDYEEGTWTPTIVIGGSSLSIDSTNCTYVKVGQIVTCWFEILGITSSNGSGAVFGGLPFSAGNNSEGAFAAMFNVVTYPAGTTQINGYHSGSSAEFRFYASGTGNGWIQLTGNDIGSGDIIGTIVYRAAS